MTTGTLVRLRLLWQRVRGRLSGDRGSYATDVAVTTAVLVAGAAVIGGIIIAFGDDLASSLQFGPPSP